MKRTAKRRLAPLLAGLGALGIMTAAYAAPGGGLPGKRGERKAAMLEKFDANKDGTLDEAERAKAHEAFKARRAEHKAERLAKYDANGDGSIDEAERAQMRTDRVVARFTALDTDGDGVLSFEEFEAGAAKMGKGKHGRRGKHMRRGGKRRGFGGKGMRGPGAPD